MVAAPRAAAGDGTGEFAAEVARLTGFGLVVAPAVDDGYERRVREVARGALAFYVEIHGSERRDSVDRIDVGTVGVDADQILKLRTLFELVRDAHLRGRAPAMRLHVRVAPAEGAAERARVERVSSRALSVELPRLARHEGRDLYTQILADFLREAIALPPPARP